MARKQRKTFELGPRAMSELFKPARLEIYESLQTAGPSSIAELAKRLGRAPDSLYYHVKKLLAIGVVEELGKKGAARAGPGRKGAVYGATARRLAVRLDPGSPRSREAWSEGGTAVLRLARRDFVRTLESGKVRAKGARRNLMLQRTKVRLNAAQLKEVNGALDRLQELLFEHAENTKGELHAITCVLTPLEERKR